MQKLVESQFEKCMFAAPDRILVATDLTDVDSLVPHAIAQAKICSAKLTFIHVIPPAQAIRSQRDANPCSANSYHDPAKIIRDARLALLGVERQVEMQGIPCETRALQGSVREVIAREIRKTDSCRLIIGTHGCSSTGRPMLGSVASDLLISIDVPVMVVGHGARELVEHSVPRRILHPVSLMDIDHSSMQLPLNVAQTCRAELTLLHVIDPDLMTCINPERVIEWAGARLKSMVPDTDLMPKVNTRICYGETAEEILKAAEQTQTDLILLGSSGHSSWSFNESVAYRVLSASSCPVLTYTHEPYRTQIEVLEAMHRKVTADSYEQVSISRQTDRSAARAL